ncbi:MAG: hydroxymethylglutaryl-CoA reductase (NADPH) [Candidatus Levybacteria bacterium]|nr:hydroxymethylglutaryl-CoA reductase (NADPH) [Candidatus Levybacteria bacterium]
MDFRAYVSVDKRRKAVEDNLKVNLSNIGNYSFDSKLASSRNCENMIGAVQIPLGIAGPLKIKSDFSEDEVFLPLATTEGALVASVNRGCKVITLSGGVTVNSQRIGITRAPVFVVNNQKEGKKFVEWVNSSFKLLKQVTESTSSHLTLLDIKSTFMGRNVYLRFRFDSQDAMGMNMATIACTKAASFIEKETKARLVAISGNMCVDKKPSLLNFIEGRGYSVSADILIPRKIVESTLKSKTESIVEVAQRKLMYGSLLSGSVGANAHYANILSAMFIATGQDAAHVAECSVGITTAEEIKGDLYVSIYLPDLVVGTVGGGTSLETQKEALSIMGISGGNNGKNARKLAEIIGGAVLAGEISLLASLADNSLASAHRKLGRGEKI